MIKTSSKNIFLRFIVYHSETACSTYTQINLEKKVTQLNMKK